MTRLRSRSHLIQTFAVSVVLAIYLTAFGFVHSRALRLSASRGTDCLMLTEVVDEASWARHCRLAVAFAPAYWVRSLLTGRSGPCVNVPLFELSNAAPDERIPGHAGSI